MDISGRKTPALRFVPVEHNLVSSKKTLFTSLPPTYVSRAVYCASKGNSCDTISKFVHRHSSLRQNMQIRIEYEMGWDVDDQ